MTNRDRQTSSAFYRGPALPSVMGRHFRRFVLIVPIVLSIYLFVGGDSGFYQIWHREKQIAALTEEIQALKMQNARLEQEAVRLETDLEAIERIARERYGMVKKNESVYMVYPHPPKKSP
ncbi:MAG: septum formation initiator family protein [bacterium]|nr:septum formation initiator family protein [bacterium]